MRMMNLWQQPNISDSTRGDDKDRKVQIYLEEMGAKEYFIHQPDLERPAEFRGWYRGTSGEIIEMTADTPRTLFSERLNLLFKWNVDVDLDVRLLRPYLPDGTPITTSIEEHQLREEAQQQRDEEHQLRIEAQQQRDEEHQLRIEAQQQHQIEEQLRIEAQQQRHIETQQRKIAEAKVEEQAEKIREQAAEIEKLRQQRGQ